MGRERIWGEAKYEGLWGICHQGSVNSPSTVIMITLNRLVPMIVIAILGMQFKSGFKGSLTFTLLVCSKL
jgi:hypothetical protein